MKLILALIWLEVGLTSTWAAIVPGFEYIHRPNGAEIYYFADQKLPLFEVHLVFEGGSDGDPKQQAGISSITAALMRKAVIRYNENNFHLELDRVAGSIDTSVSDDHLQLSAYGLLDDIDRIFELTQMICFEPSMPADTFKRMKKNQIENIEQISDDPDAVAKHILGLLLYNNTAKARPDFGLINDLKKLTLAEVVQWQKTWLTSKGLKVLVVGSKNKDQVLNKVIKLVDNFKNFNSNHNAKSLYQLDNFNYQPGLIQQNYLVVNRPGISQTHVAMGFLGPSRLVDDYYALKLSEMVLSGPFGSRLNQRLREQLNLTYAVSADFELGKEMGHFIFNAATKTETLAPFLAESNKIFSQWLENGITAQELQLAKEYWMGSFPLSLSNLYSIAALFFRGILLGLPTNYLDQHLTNIEAVSLAQVNASIKRHYQFDKMIMILVGDQTQIKRQLPKIKAKALSLPLKPWF